MPDDKNRDDIDDLMADTFGTAADDEHLDDADADEDLDENLDPEPDPEPEPDEDEDTDDDEDGDEDEDLDDLDDDEDDDTDEDDDSDVGDDDGESEDEGGDPDEGEGAEETLSDGLMALDLAVDMTLKAYVAPNDDFDPDIVGTEAEYIEDHKAELGDDYDEAYAAKMGRTAYRAAVRAAKRKHEAQADDRLQARRDRDTADITQQVHALTARVGPKEMKRVQARMARVYQDKIDASSLDAANTIPVEHYFRLAGGKLPTRQKAKSKVGVASKRARAQKKGAVRRQQPTDQVTKVRSGKKRKASPDDEIFNGVNEHYDTHKRIEDLLFGD